MKYATVTLYHADGFTAIDAEDRWYTIRDGRWYCEDTRQLIENSCVRYGADEDCPGCAKERMKNDAGLPGDSQA